MSVRIVTIILFWLLVNFCLCLPEDVVAKSWYVDNQSVGVGNGSSWRDAWKNLANINFELIKDGDVIFISGGIYSKIYEGTIKVGPGVSGITITKGIDAGHNGEVIFDGKNIEAQGISINGQGKPVKNLKIEGISFKNYKWAGVYGNGQNSGGLQGITVDGCKFIDFNRAGVFFEGNNNIENNYNLVVKNSYFNDNDNGTGQSDGIFVQVLKDFVADNNKIVLDNNYTGVADLHSDNIQSFWVDDVVYSNNWVEQRSNKTLGTQMLFTENGYGVHAVINNVFVRDTPLAEDSAIRLKSGDGSSFSGVVQGNTYFGKGRILNSSVVSIIRNNIFYGISQPTVARTFYITGNGSEVANNIFYDPNNMFPSTSGGVEADPKFVNPDFYNIDLRLKDGSPGINSGSVVGGKWVTDITGKLRGNSWDIGAYENDAISSGQGGVTDGDSNSDKKVDLVDFSQWKLEYTKQLETKTSDFNKDGKVDLVDFGIWKNGYLNNR